MALSLSTPLRVVFIMLLSLLLGGCQTVDSSRCEGISTGLGAVIGGVIGSQLGSGTGRTAATVVGAGLGAWIGREIGARMTCEDRQEMSTVLDETPAGESRSWSNPETGNVYTMTPQSPFAKGDQQCRHFEMQVVVDGEPRRTEGTACRRPDDQAWSTV
ncbi:glycine zipper 2TM domain-containing protein [Halomonas rhizosphaerae]|uniref:Glycine zipper 2TM domain-containing protein n=1 Tax=Halomonas rhizosphaerae TaxID=3043296 RepID=A0ABT6UZY4_9GAMM|nr:glycine zipper 2TM domain-containing protein [Halomonas rhizosphaerae]MDI5891505.1 glycine zipper 2TM domain-containing protein [Halomonas rhizosphaerae]MDI5919818.1 glycine zipper 2TM domain-containing protein [Halomonas rhizosphaerae]